MQNFTGIIISAKSPKTVKVAVEYTYRHPKYQKILRRTTKVLAHSEIEGLKEGDKVQIAKSKPFSKLKHFIVVDKV